GLVELPSLYVGWVASAGCRVECLGACLIMLALLLWASWACLLLTIRDDLRLLRGCWKGLVELPSLYVGWVASAGCRVDVLGWACLDDACTLLWASFGLACSGGYEMVL
ncbi:hypothetical protein CSA_015444, partial [Cucumis sativus]